MRKILATAVLLCAGLAHAAVPQRLNYQGKLADAAGDPLTGTYSFRFKLFASEGGGSALFSEDVAGADAVSVVNGIYTVQIGSLTPGGVPYGVFENPDLYLEIDVQAGTDLTGAETLSPRERLNASAWALHALGAERLGAGAVIATFTATGALELPAGSTVASNGTLSLSTAASAALTGTPAVFIDRDGEVGIGTTAPASAKLHVAGQVRYGVTQTVSGAASITFSGLDGNVDKIYELTLTGHLNVTGAADGVFLGLNNDFTAANYRSLLTNHYQDAAAPCSNTHTGTSNYTQLCGFVSEGTSPGFNLGWIGYGTDGDIFIQVKLAAESGRSRICHAEYAVGNSADTNLLSHRGTIDGWWSDTTSNITSLVIDIEGSSTFTGTAVLRTVPY